MRQRYRAAGQTPRFWRDACLMSINQPCAGDGRNSATFVANHNLFALNCEGSVPLTLTANLASFDTISSKGGRHAARLDRKNLPNGGNDRSYSCAESRLKK